MPYRAVLFDLDGTLLDTLEDIADAANEVLGGRGLPVHPMEAYRGFVGEGVTRLVTRVLPEEKRDPATVRGCVEGFLAAYARNWRANTKPYPGVPEMLDALAGRGMKLAVLSNKPDEFTRVCVREILSGWAFLAVMGLSDAISPKPDPAGAREIARRLGVPPEGFLYVGDSGIDMRTAAAARMFPVGALWGFRGREELERDGARALIAHPEELLSLLGAREERGPAGTGGHVT